MRIEFFPDPKAVENPTLAVIMYVPAVLMVTRLLLDTVLCMPSVSHSSVSNRSPNGVLAFDCAAECLRPHPISVTELTVTLDHVGIPPVLCKNVPLDPNASQDRKSTRLNSSH